MVDKNLLQKYVTTDKIWKYFLYVKVPKALYGLFNSALLFYKKLVGYLEYYVLKTNTYNPCV